MISFNVLFVTYCQKAVEFSCCFCNLRLRIWPPAGAMPFFSTLNSFLSSLPYPQQSQIRLVVHYHLLVAILKSSSSISSWGMTYPKVMYFYFLNNLNDLALNTQLHIYFSLWCFFLLGEEVVWAGFKLFSILLLLFFVGEVWGEDVL